MPVYNSEKYLSEMLDSILAQAFEDFELIAINDGSKDNSLAILNDYAKRNSRIVAIDKENTGVSDTRNLGLRTANGDYICCVDSDDYLSPDYLNTLYHIAIEKQADMVVCNYQTFHGTPSFTENRFEAQKIGTSAALVQAGVLTSACTKLIKKSALYNNNVTFPVGVTFGEDLFFSWKAYIVCESVWYIDKRLYGYRLTGESATSKYHKNIYQNYQVNFTSLREFAVKHGKETEVKAIDYFFTKRLPTFMMMTARSKLSFKDKIKHVEKVISDQTICSVLNGQWSDFSRLLTSEEIALYKIAKNRKYLLCLLFGYKLNTRMKLSTIKSRLRG